MTEYAMSALRIKNFSWWCWWCTWKLHYFAISSSAVNKLSRLPIRGQTWKYGQLGVLNFDNTFPFTERLFCRLWASSDHCWTFENHDKLRFDGQQLINITIAFTRTEFDLVLFVSDANDEAVYAYISARAQEPQHLANLLTLRFTVAVKGCIFNERFAKYYLYRPDLRMPRAVQTRAIFLVHSCKTPLQQITSNTNYPTQHGHWHF